MPAEGLGKQVGSGGCGHELATTHNLGCIRSADSDRAPTAENRSAVQTARAGTGTRTRDPLFTRQVLYQLSYSGGLGQRSGSRATRSVVQAPVPLPSAAAPVSARSRSS
jgi:hypothetical protein